MWTIWMVAMGAALAAAPPEVRPVVAPADVMAMHQRQAPDAAPLACEPLWTDHAMLCFRVWEGRTRRWVTTDDLARWKTTTAELRGAMRAQAPKHLNLERREVGGMEASWYLLADGDGWAAAGPLLPEALAEKVGRPLRVAIPAQGVLVAWQARGRELDHVMLVGVRDLFEGQPDPVSPTAHTWDGSAWRPFARAVPRSPEAD